MGQSGCHQAWMHTGTHIRLGCILVRISGLDAYWYAYQETGDLHTLAATLLNVGEIISAEKFGKAKNKKGEPQRRETQGAVVRQDWNKDYWPGTSQIPACVSRWASW